MNTPHNLLVELLVEELPPKSLKALGEAFGAGLLAGLRAQGLATVHSALTTELLIARVVAVHYPVAEFAVQRLRAQSVRAGAVSLITAVSTVQ